MIADETIIPCFCEEILLEYKTVLYREAFSFNPLKVDELLKRLRSVGKITSVTKSDMPMIDESDRVFYDVAKECKAILITGNAKHYPKESFIMSPAEFLSVLS